MIGMLLALAVILIFSTAVLANKHHDATDKDKKHHEVDENDDCELDDAHEHQGNEVNDEEDGCAITPPPPPPPPPA